MVNGSLKISTAERVKCYSLGCSEAKLGMHVSIVFWQRLGLKKLASSAKTRICESLPFFGFHNRINSLFPRQRWYPNRSRVLAEPGWLPEGYVRPISHQYMDSGYIKPQIEGNFSAKAHLFLQSYSLSRSSFWSLPRL